MTTDERPSRFLGKVALVTGGASGIGEAVCRALDAEGARVAVVDLDEVGAEAVASQLAFGIAIRADVTSSDDVSRAFAQAGEQLGPIDVLVTAAGIDDPEAKQSLAGSLADGLPIDVTSHLTDDRWNRMLRVNLDGTFFAIRAALHVMLDRETGAIVTVASSAAFDALAGYPHYSAAKAGVVALTASVGKEVVGRGVRVNGVAPGPTRTPMTARTPSLKPSPADSRVRPIAAAEEIASIVTFLASDDAVNIAGEVLLANGGRFTR